jgi:glycosyltransferase involved in cell wall biosynthesis
MSRISCSVVVCTRHRPALLARCLASLTRLDHPRYELIVVDNTAGEHEIKQMAGEAGARYIVESRTGLSRARNAGGLAAKGDIVAYVDDDAVADSWWLSAHAVALEDPALVATTGRILPISRDAPAARLYEAFGGEDLGDVAFRVDRNTPAWFERANFGGVGVGGNMAFRRALFETGWGFRDSLGLGASIPGEEHYAFFTLIREGHAIAYLPEAIVYHDYPATTATVRRRRSRILRGAAAYMAMLLVEEPQFRRDTLRYMWKAARATPRGWQRGYAEKRLSNRLQLFAAICGGVPLYMRSLLTDGARVSAPRVRLPPAKPERRRRSTPD